MNLLSKRNYFKPLQYPWAFDAYFKQQQLHWLPSEVPMHEDVKDWNLKLSSAEKNLLTQIFRFFTQGDIDVSEGYAMTYMPIFGGHPEVRMMMLAFAAMEANHVHAYSLLLDTIGMPEAEYQAFAKYQEMKDKHDYVEGFQLTPDDVDDMTNGGNWAKDYKAGIAKTKASKALAVYSAFTEGLQLFSSFAILLNFSRFGKMKGMGQIVTWSVRDETLHVDSMIKLFRTFLEENPEIDRKKLEEDITKICIKMVSLEDAFIDLAFEQGGIEGLTPQEVKDYIRYIADMRMEQLGFGTIFSISKNPLPWLDYILNGLEHANFFEQRATEYSKGALTGSYSDGYGDVS